MCTINNHPAAPEFQSFIKKYYIPFAKVISKKSFLKKNKKIDKKIYIVTGCY